MIEDFFPLAIGVVFSIVGIAMLAGTRPSYWDWMYSESTKLNPIHRFIYRLIPTLDEKVASIMRVVLQVVGVLLTCVGPAIFLATLYNLS